MLFSEFLMNLNSSDESRKLHDAYNEQYSDKMTEWRELGAKYKARNIVSVCSGRSFNKVLECGAGEGSVLQWLDAAGFTKSLHALEISDSGISQIEKRKIPSLSEIRKFDGYTIPYAAEEFELAYCSHVLEHVEHPRLLLRELKRVSKFQVFEIPLDYSMQVDKKIQHYLSYGHINIFTPSLFKFLLKSEGFEIINERFTTMKNEVRRFNWYRNMGRKKTLVTEAMITAYPWYQSMKRLLYGKARHDEYGYSAYTCLAKSSGELRVF
jgi:ubiquinone/menaquinone biosynthesis C-methylase UbiE